MDQILFYLFAATAVLAGLLAVTRKNAVASASWLVVMFFGLAAIYVTLEAPFVAAVQILVYAGAIMVLFLFVIMLLDLRTSELAAHSGPKLKVVGVVLSVAFTAAVLHALREADGGSSIADRLTVTLRRAAPAAPAGGSALDAPGAARAPAPVDVELSETTPEAAASELGDAPGGDLADGRGDRAYAGELDLAGDGKAATTPLRVTVSPDGAAAVAIAGKTLATAPWRVDGGRRAVAYDVPGAAGASIEVVLQRSGLEPREGGGPDGSPRGIGKALFETWLLPFEVASLLLTGAIFGVVVLTKRRLA